MWTKEEIYIHFMIDAPEADFHIVNFRHNIRGKYTPETKTYQIFDKHDLELIKHNNTMSEDTHETTEHKTMGPPEYNQDVKTQHPSLANYAGLLTFLCLGGIGIGTLIGYNIGKPTPTIYNLSIQRPDREPLVIPITTQHEANWFLPVGTNPVVITRISLDKPTN